MNLNEVKNRLEEYRKLATDFRSKNFGSGWGNTPDMNVVDLMMLGLLIEINDNIKNIDIKTEDVKEEKVKTKTSKK